MLGDWALGLTKRCFLFKWNKNWDEESLATILDEIKSCGYRGHYTCHFVKSVLQTNRWRGCFLPWHSWRPPHPTLEGSLLISQIQGMQAQQLPRQWSPCLSGLTFVQTPQAHSTGLTVISDTQLQLTEPRRQGDKAVTCQWWQPKAVPSQYHTETCTRFILCHNVMWWRQTKIRGGGKKRTSANLPSCVIRL